MIPSFDGPDERRVRLFETNTQVGPERRTGKLLKRLEGRAFDSTEGTPNGVENLLDHLRIHFEPIEVFGRGRVVDDFVCEFERQPGEEIKEYEPPRDAMRMAILKLAHCEGVFPCIKNSQERTLPKWWRPRMKRTRKSMSSRTLRFPMMSGRSSTRKQWS